MKITNVETCGFNSSLIASGYPMAVNIEEYRQNAKVTECIDRAVKLSNSPIGSGHDNFLAGMIVLCDVTASNAWWLQMGRYHFVQIVSSQSKMHRLRQMLGGTRNEREHFSDLTPAEICERMFRLQAIGDATDEELVYACPMGFELTARISTNYRQLKTIYAQRRTHKLREWREFCVWIEHLQMADGLFCRKIREGGKCVQ